MAARVTSAEVLQIFDAPSGVTDLSMFIAPATALVDQHIAGRGYSDTLLAQIELWLSAHFACMRYQQLTAQGIGDGSDTYANAVGSATTGLGASRYGQQALALDPTGKLAKLSSTKRHNPSIQVLGQVTDDSSE